MTDEASYAKYAAECVCRDAVLRTFGELRQRYNSEEAALKSAATVYRYHHPEVPEAQALETVRRWV